MPKAGEVSAGLAESNGNLTLVYDSLIHLWADCQDKLRQRISSKTDAHTEYKTFFL